MFPLTRFLVRYLGFANSRGYSKRSYRGEGDGCMGSCPNALCLLWSVPRAKEGPAQWQCKALHVSIGWREEVTHNHIVFDVWKCHEVRVEREVMTYSPTTLGPKKKETRSKQMKPRHWSAVVDLVLSLWIKRTIAKALDKGFTTAEGKDWMPG